MIKLTPQRVKELLHYDQESGVFAWKVQASNAIKIGAVAGSRNNLGYMRISIDSVFYFSHRLAWFYMCGEMPNGEIDHINGIRNDNRIANLRLADREINSQNVSLRSNNRSGYMGVSFYRPNGKWKAQIACGGKSTHLGYFETPESAHFAYLDAKKAMHKGFVPARVIEMRASK